MTYRKVGRYRYFGRVGKYYFFIYAREHGRFDGFEKYQRWYTARIGKEGRWLYVEGQFTSYLKTLKRSFQWVRGKIKDDWYAL